MNEEGENMKIIHYISAAAIPVVILLIIVYGVKEKKKVFDIFLDGAKCFLLYWDYLLQ